jgi:hypothetical protein
MTRRSALTLTMIALLGLVVLFTTALPRIAFAQSDPLIGTWKLNLARSTYSPGPPPRSQTATFQAEGQGLRETLEAINALAPTVGPASSGTQGAAYIPDFSGIWAHPSLNALEQPLLGPGPVRNTSRLRTGPQAGVGNVAQLVGDYTNPILRPWAAEVVKKFGEISLAGKGYPTPRNQCWPEGMPFVFSNLGMQMLQQPDKITILYPFDHQFRQVRMNQPHPTQVTPSWYGD